MKVGMLLGSLSREGGGVFEAVLGLSKALTSTQHVTVHAFGLYDSHFESDRTLWGSIPVMTRRRLGPPSIDFAPGLTRVLLGQHLDILHTHNLWKYQSYASLTWSVGSDAPFIISVHGALDTWALGRARWKKMAAALAYENRHLRRASVLHALTSQELGAIRHYGLSNPVCVIPNGVDIAVAGATDPPPWAGVLPGGCKILLYLGRLHPKKNLQSLLAAWRMIEHDRPMDTDAWWLVVVGWDQSGYGESLRSFANDAGLKRVWFAGPRFGAEKRACLARADAFVLPSLSEGLPVAVLEAWAGGLAVAMTRASNLEEGFDAGAAIPVATDTDGLFHDLVQLLQMSDAERTNMGRNGRALVEQQYTWDVAASKMYAVYQWVLGGGTPPSSVEP